MDQPQHRFVKDRRLDHDAPVMGVIRLLLLPLLPIELAGALDHLARHVAKHPDVAFYSTKMWGDLPESAQAAVKREVRIIARSVNDN